MTVTITFNHKTVVLYSSDELIQCEGYTVQEFTSKDGLITINLYQHSPHNLSNDDQKSIHHRQAIIHRHPTHFQTWIDGTINPDSPKGDTNNP